MSIRHPLNRNLILHFDPLWHGQPVNVRGGPLINEYLSGIDDTLWAATNDHIRTLAIRVDLRFPSDGVYSSTGRISRFIESLKAKIAADLKRRQRKDSRVHPTSVRVIWARERHDSSNFHFHVVILLNYDTYRVVGAYGSESGAAFMIRSAWATATGIPLEAHPGLVQFTNGSGTLLDINSSGFSEAYDDLFFQLSYLAKVYTKEFGDRENNFGCSRHPGRADPRSRVRGRNVLQKSAMA